MKRRLIFFMITAVIAMLIMILINSALKTKQATIEALQRGRAEIVVAARNLTPGTAIDAASVKLAAWPRDDLPPGALNDPKQAQDQVVTQDVTQNEPIVSGMLLQRGASGGVLPFLIPNGMRAMSIPVTPVSDMAGMILPHTRVDVLVTSEAGGQAEHTRIVLQDVEVLASQTKLDVPSNEPQHAEVVTLLVTPPDAERLAAAIRLGTLQVAMRSYSDRQPVQTVGVDARELLGLPSLPEPQQSPAIMPVQKMAAPRRQIRARPEMSIEVIRNGKERQTVSFASTASPVANSGLSNAVDP
jgi:pilus assembly protein CpaB